MLRRLSPRSRVRLVDLPPPSLLLEARGVSSSRWLERFVQHLALCRTDYRCGTPHERRPMWSRSLSRAARASVHRTVALGSLVLLFGTASRHAEAAVVAIVPSSYVAGTGGGADPNADLSLPNANVASGSYGWFLNFPRASTSGEDLFLNALNQFVFEGSTATGLLGDVGGSDQNFFGSPSRTTPHRLHLGDSRSARLLISGSFRINPGAHSAAVFISRMLTPLPTGEAVATWALRSRKTRVQSCTLATWKSRGTPPPSPSRCSPVPMKPLQGPPSPSFQSQDHTFCSRWPQQQSGSWERHFVADPRASARPTTERGVIPGRMSRPGSRAQPGGRKRECTSERSHDGAANARLIGLGSPRAAPPKEPNFP